MSLIPDRPVRQILPQRVVFNEPWFGIAARPEDMLLEVPVEQVGIAVAVDAEDVQQALVQAEVVTRSGPVMAMLFIDWKILRPESSPFAPGAKARFDIELGPDDQ